MKPCLRLVICLSSIFLLNHPYFLLAQQLATVKGSVSTSDGKPAAGVSISLTNYKGGTSTDQFGAYEIKNVPYGTYTLKVSAVGLNSKTLAIAVNEALVEVPVLTLSENASQLEEVIVSGIGINPYTRKRSTYVAKQPLNNLENPQVYTVITKELLKDQLVTNFNDALKNSSGIDKLWTSTGRSGDGAAYFSLRGFQMQPSLINGIAAVTNGDLDPANIEQIEVVKGPSGSLYGGALVNFGGLVNIVTKRPLDTLGGDVSYTVGSYDQHRITADLYGPLTPNKKLLARINAAYHSQNSWQDAGLRRSLFIAPSLEYRANDRLTINLDAEIFQYKGTNPLMVFLNRSRQLFARTPDELQFDFNKSYTSDDLTFKTPTTNFRGQVNYKLSNQWTSSTRVNYNRRKTKGYYQYVMYLAPDNDTTLSRMITNQDALSQIINIQQNFNGDFRIGSLRNRFLVGLDFLRQINDNNNAPYITFDQVNTAVDDPEYGNMNKANVDAALAASSQPYTYNHASTNIYSAYVSDVVNITDRLLAMLSLRLDRFESKGTTNLNNGQTAGGYGQTAWSPKFGLVYQVVKDQVSLFANYMNGFRNVAPVTQPLPDISGTFKPQQARQWEGGVKLDVLDNRLSFTASYYDISVTNMTRSEALVRDDTTYLITVQNGTQLSRGFELDLTARPIDGLSLILGYSNNYSEITNASEYLDGRRPVGAGPRQLLNFWTSYRINQGVVRGLGFGFGGNYASKNIITNDARTGIFTLPAYTVLNANLFYDVSKFRIGLKLDNLTDKVYYKGWTTVEPQMPRSFLVNVTYKL